MVFYLSLWGEFGPRRSGPPYFKAKYALEERSPLKVDSKTNISADKANDALEEALTRLERALLNRENKGQMDVGEQAVYIEQLETDNKKKFRDLETLTKKYADLKDRNAVLEKKCQLLEKTNDSAEKELAIMLKDLDLLISQKNLH